MADQEDSSVGDVVQVQSPQEVDIAAMLLAMNTTLNKFQTETNKFQTDSQAFQEEITNNMARMEEKFMNQEEKVIQFLENFKQDTREEIGKIQEQINNINQENREQEHTLQNKLTHLCRSIEDTCTQNIQNAITPIEKEIENIRMDRTLTSNLQEKINIVVNPNLLRAEEKEKFTGDYKANPKIFIKNLKNEVQDLGEEINLRKYLRGRFAGDAELWYNIVEEDFITFSEFEKIFVKYYWSSMTQAKIRENLYSGTYNENFNVSRERYAMRKYAIVKELDPPMEEADIIQYLSRHFEEDITNMIAMHEIRNIERLLQYLKRIDSSRDNRRRNMAQEKYNRWDGGRIDQNNRSMNNYNNQNTNYNNRNNNNNKNNNYNHNNNYNNNNNTLEKRNYNNYRNQNYRRNYNEEERKEKEKDGRFSNGVTREQNQGTRLENDRRQRRNSDPGETKQQENKIQENRQNQTNRQVHFDDIAIVHNEPDTDQNFY